MRRSMRHYTPDNESLPGAALGDLARDIDIQTIVATTRASHTAHVAQTTPSGAGANPSGGHTRLKLATTAPRTDMTRPRYALAISNLSLRVTSRTATGVRARSSSWARAASMLLVPISSDALIEVKRDPPSTTHNRTGITNIPHLLPEEVVFTTEDETSIIDHSEREFHHGLV